MVNNRKLMVSIVAKQKALDFIKFLNNNDVTDTIFILTAEKQKNVYIMTYNLKYNFNLSNLSEYGVKSTISAQRNKGTNTIYSINALNCILYEEQLKTEKDKKDIIVSWEKYRNSFVTSVEDGELNITKTKLHKIIVLNNTSFDINKIIL